MNITLTSIAQRKKVTYRAIKKRRDKEKWNCAGTVIVNHKPTEVFDIETLPEDIKTLFLGTHMILTSDGDKSLYMPTPEPIDDRLSSICKVPASQLASETPLPPAAKKVALARMDLLRAWEGFRKSYKKVAEADEEFLTAFNSGILYKNIYETLGNVSIKSLYRWKDLLGDSSNYTKLVPLYYCKTPEGSQLSKDEINVVMNICLNPRNFRIGTAIRLTKAYLRSKGISTSKSDRTFRRFVEQFKTKHNDIWVLMRQGQKALRDKVEPFIKRDPSLLNVGDVLVADGHRLNFSIISPFTGKPCRAVLVGYVDWKSYDLAGYEIMLEENTQCIASALRNSILRLGRSPKIAYQDNGKAFRSRFFAGSESFEEIGIVGLFGRLGIIPVFATPYNARAKIIERWFREFSDTCERLSPSYTGASIIDKPAWMLRNEKFHKALHNEYVPTLNEAIQMIESWLAWHRSNPCPHVKGKTIGQVFEEGKGNGVDIEQLDDLMMDVQVGKIGRNGIRFLTAEYYDDNLYGLAENVLIKYDLFDLSYLKVYSLKGDYLCKAARVASIHPMAKHLGNAKDISTLKHEISRQRRLEKKTIQNAKELISMGKRVELDWQSVIAAAPSVVEKIEQENIGLPETIENIPDEAVRRGAAPSAGARDDAEPIENNVGDQERPFFGTDKITRYEWHLKYGFKKPDDLVFKEEFESSDIYRLSFGFFEEQEKEIKKAAMGSR